VSGKRLIDEGVRERMKQVLKEIQDGTFAKRWIEENERGRQEFNRMREEQRNHPIEKVGAKLREMMVWVNKKEPVNQS